MAKYGISIAQSNQASWWIPANVLSLSRWISFWVAEVFARTAKGKLAGIKGVAPFGILILSNVASPVQSYWYGESLYPPRFTE